MMVNPQEIHDFLETLGYETGETIYFRTISDKATGKLESLLPLSEQPLNTLSKLNQQGRGIYVVINGGGHKDLDVPHGKAIWYEHDNLPIDVQLNLWETVGLPQPTMQVATGGKSIHSYWAFYDPIPLAQWIKLQADLLELVDGDRTIKNPSRVMRLPGTIHQTTGNYCKIISLSGQCYDFVRIRAIVPEPVQPSKPKPVQRPQPATDAILLQQCLSKLHREWLNGGVGEGSRNRSGYALATDLIGTASHLDAIGQRYEPQARDLFDDFVQSCTPPIDPKEADRIWQSALKTNPKPCLSEDKIQACIKAQTKPADTRGNISKLEPEPEEQELEPHPLERMENLIRTRFFDRLKFNTLFNQVELDGEYLDPATAKLIFILKHKLRALKGSREDIADVCISIAKESQFSPIVEYLETVHNAHGNSTSILDGLAERYFGSKATIHQTLLVKWLVAAVARAYQPGCKFDCALILQGKQGYGKSSFFQILASPDWFDDSLGAVSDKDERLKLQRSWVIEWSELETVFKRKDVSQVKAFLSCSVDLVRPPYGRSVEIMKRGSVIVGTTNEGEFLADTTGSRRFWVIPMSFPLDRERLKAERDLIWAAAVALYKTGEEWWLDDADEQLAEDSRERYQIEDPWQEPILQYLDENHEVLISRILKDVLGVDRSQDNGSQTRRVRNILTRLGWSPVPNAIYGHQGRGRYWKKEAEMEE